MMIDPKGFVETLKEEPYERLIKERDRLIRSIRRFEKEEREGCSEGEIVMCPSPDVIYQMELQYLSKLCVFMYEKYNTEYVWGDKTLCKADRE